MTRIVATALVALIIGAGSLAAQDKEPKMPPAAHAAAALNLNTATAAQLEGLPGIGKATAERIVEYRQKSGGFKKIEDLMNVRGIGEKNFLKLKPLITVGPARAQSERAAQ
jgi:competence protein ComEA